MLPPNQLCADEWNTKEDPHNSIKNALFTYCGMSEGTSRAEATSNSKKNQVCNLSHYLDMLVWQSFLYVLGQKNHAVRQSIACLKNQSGNRSVENYIIFEIL